MDVLDTGLTEHDGEIVDSERVARPLIEDTEVDDTGNTVDRTFALEDGEEVPPTRIGSVCFDGSAIFRILELDNLRVRVAESVVFGKDGEGFFIAAFGDKPSRRFGASETENQSQDGRNDL